MIAKLTGSGFPKSTGQGSRKAGSQQTSGRTIGVILKVIRMITKRLHIVIVLLAIGCQQAEVNADKPSPTVNKSNPNNPVEQKDRKTPTKPVSQAKLTRQLKINRDTLLKGSSEQIRIDAATEMLFSEAPAARKILLDALKQSENSAARVAVCKALSQTRTTQESIRQIDDFIQPLLEALTSEQGSDRAKLVAEATLIFEYEQIQKQLEKVVTDASQPPKARLNAIKALKRPDIGAISKLMDLLDDPENQVVLAAEEAIKALGMPVGRDAEARRQIINELQRKGRDEFLRDWLIRLERDMARVEAERNFWQKQYLAAQDRIYVGISDDAEKGKFLAEHLAGSEAIMRLWALEKVYQGRLGTGAKSKLPADLGPILVGLVSDQNRDVQLKTAKLLSLMGELNSAKKLLEQLKVEKDDEVRFELFVALGGACYYAFSPNSGIEISPEIRKQALEEAAKYLVEVDRQKAQKGAEVIKKLLEQDGLTSADIDKYLGLLHQRYSQNDTDDALRGELLNAMAGLCAQSVYKDQAKNVFESLFEKALNDAANLVREAALDGLAYIDPKRALKIARNDFVNDSSIAVQTKLIELAGAVGDKEDLDWLLEKMVISAESEPAWQTMLKIFKRSDAAVLSKWVTRFDSQSIKTRLSGEQRGFFLEMAEQKALGESNPEMLKVVRGRLAQLYTQNGNFQQAAKYLGLMRESAETTEEKQAISAKLLDVYLQLSNVDAAVQLVENSLLEKDLDPNDIIVLSIDSYLIEPSSGADPNEILEALAQIQTPEARPEWAEHLKRWQELFGDLETVPEPNQTGG